MILSDFCFIGKRMHKYEYYEALEKENTELKQNIEKMKNFKNCQTFNEWQCPYARNGEKKYVHPNDCDCPCDKWGLKVVK